MYAEYTQLQLTFLALHSCLQVTYLMIWQRSLLLQETIITETDSKK